MKSPFEILDEKEMTETINEGSELLMSLEAKMKDNNYIVVKIMIKIYFKNNNKKGCY